MKIIVAILSMLNLVSSSLYNLSPDPNSCSTFKVHYLDTVETTSCLAGLHFSPRKLSCMLPEEAKCEQKYWCSGSSAQPYVADPDNSTVYYECVNGLPVKRYCDYGLFWDIEVNQCKTPANFHQIEIVSTTTTTTTAPRTTTPRTTTLCTTTPRATTPRTTTPRKTTPTVAPIRDSLNPGDCLYSGEFLESKNKCFRLYLQTDGNVVVYRMSTMTALWNVGSHGSCMSRLCMQTDGNFVLYKCDGPARWNANTFAAGSYIIMQDDGNLVIYRNTAGHTWATMTLSGC